VTVVLEASVWALHLHPAAGPDILLVLQLPAGVTDPPAVHAAALVTRGDRPERCLAGLGWVPTGQWRPRSYGAVCPVQIGRPHP
jgi:hypothetical protein